MLGLYLMAIVIAWIAIDWWLVGYFTSGFPQGRRRLTAHVVGFAVLLPVPLIDEIVAKYQFERLCAEHSSIRFDRDSARDRVVYLAPAADKKVNDAWVRTLVKQRNFVDRNTGESVISYTELSASGGIFARTVGLSEGGRPLVFKGSCGPGSYKSLDRLFSELNVQVVPTPKIPRTAR